MTLPFVMLASSARASIAYGSVNNFDTVNDTGTECHGFEIELDDCRSVDITYTYNYNHYGVPRMTEDNSTPGHPRVFIRWESARLPDGTWSAYTAIPSGPIAPTDGHMFTNPAVNFGGEHFGVGFTIQPSAILYFWLIDNGSGSLVRGGQVQVATPTFVYYPPVVGNPALPQVQAEIQPPPPPEPPTKEFGDAVWVKEIRTTTHNNHEVGLRDLVSDDPDDDDDKNWRNGEPDEVEVEWQILQKDYNKADGGANAVLAAAPEDLDQGDEVVTRRYEFFKYLGPLDEETGEAMGDKVGPDDQHGVGIKEINGVEVDLSTVEVVGDFIGSQMAAVDVDAPVGLIDHLQDGEVGSPYPDRRVVIEGAQPFTATSAGILPLGMDFDPVTGILSGTPLESGGFSFAITAHDGLNPAVEKQYSFVIAEVGQALPARSLLDLQVMPVGAGRAIGGGSFEPGAQATVHAESAPGFVFVEWTDNGRSVGLARTHSLPMDVHHTLIAHFRAEPAATNVIEVVSAPLDGGVTFGGGAYVSGSNVTVSATASAGYVFRNWTVAGAEVSAAGAYSFPVAAHRRLQANFTLIQPGMEIGSDAAGIPFLEWPANLPNWVLEECHDLKLGDWVESVRPLQTIGGRFHVEVDDPSGTVYLRLRHP